VRGKVQPFEFGPSQKIDSGVADRWSKNAIFSLGQFWRKKKSRRVIKE